MDRALGPGDVVAGKYRVERILGEGGMGVVLGARHVTLDEPVAIKVLKPAATQDADAVARFFREARAAVRIKGEHVARVLDVGSLEDGTPYMLMEQLEGSDLDAIVERGGFLSVPTAIDYVLQACEALAEAHALGIVHRDIKPSNLFLTHRVDGTPCVKVLDFGISKATNAIDATRPDYGLTQTQTVMGSPQYMAPEQMRSSRRVDGRTDIWALGTIVHELLTGEPPFSASTMPELFAMILQDPAPSLRARRPDVPPELDAVVMRCLAKSPEERPASVLELAHLLGPFASALSTGAAERIGRVGRNVASASAHNIASNQANLASSAASSARVASPPSFPELAHANTTRIEDVPARHPRVRRHILALAIAAPIASAILVSGMLMLAARSRERAVAAGASGEAVSAPVVAVAPPSVAAATSEPRAASAASAAASAGSDAGVASASSAVKGSEPRPGSRPAAVAVGRPPLSGPAASAANVPRGPSVAPTAPAPAPAGRAPEAPHPATTATSRYD